MLPCSSVAVGEALAATRVTGRPLYAPASSFRERENEVAWFLLGVAECIMTIVHPATVLWQCRRHSLDLQLSANLLLHLASFISLLRILRMCHLGAMKGRYNSGCIDLYVHFGYWMPCTF